MPVIPIDPEYLADAFANYHEALEILRERRAKEKAQMQEWQNVDKSEWGTGPWQDEPDKRQWVDPATGLNCLIVRGPAGALCGYVGVRWPHQAHGKGYSDLELEVHGGITFGGGCHYSEDPGKGVCHVPAPGEPDNIWWLGFDCANAWDICPEMDTRDRIRGWAPGGGDRVYRTIAYVTAEVESLARQLKAMEDHGGPA